MFRLLIVSFLCLSPPRAHNCLVSMLLSPIPPPVIDQMESLSLIPIYYNNRGYRSEYWANSDLPQGAGQQNTHDYVPQYRAAHLFPTALMNIHLCPSLALVALNLFTKLRYYFHPRGGFPLLYDRPLGLTSYSRRTQPSLANHVQGDGLLAGNGVEYVQRTRSAFL